MKYSQEDNLLIQSYFTISLLGELNNLNFLESDYYRNANFKDKFVKENLPSVGIDNQGTLLNFLFTMLVIPKQILENKYPNEFIKLNKTIDLIKLKASSDYKFDVNGIDYVGHIRNSVAHSRVNFSPNKTVTFSDKNKSGNECKITIPLDKIGIFLTQLQKLFFSHIQNLKKPHE